MPFPAKPTAIHLLEGGAQKTHRPMNNEEPQPDGLDKLPQPPRFMPKFGKEEWFRLGETFRRIGTLTEVDLSVLERYCFEYALWRDCARLIMREGATIQTPTGVLQVNPRMSIMRNAADEMRKAGAQLGIGAADRTKLKTGAVAEQRDEVGDFLNQRQMGLFSSGD